ncbi:hypothetical protein F4780DRAFT_407804 [Xylariomycetidae sp. FL0641]|nr:hypothetical protein F4780DRAFT_407804 [Xylariomycetidae sp. FL0641]
MGNWSLGRWSGRALAWINQKRALDKLLLWRLIAAFSGSFPALKPPKPRGVGDGLLRGPHRSLIIGPSKVPRLSAVQELRQLSVRAAFQRSCLLSSMDVINQLRSKESNFLAPLASASNLTVTASGVARLRCPFPSDARRTTPINNAPMLNTPRSP